MIEDAIVMTEVELELWEKRDTVASTQAKKMNTAAHAELVMFFMLPHERMSDARS